MARVVVLLACAALCVMVSSLNIPEIVDNPYDLSNVVYTTNGITATATYHLGETAAPEIVVNHLLVNITYDTPQRLRIRMTDQDDPTGRWEVPNDLPPYTIDGSFGAYNVTVNQNPMGITVTRASDQRVVFNLDPSVIFSYDDQDILFVNNLGYGINVMGLGERICPFILPQGSYTLWARDRGSPIDDGVSEVGNMYSSQPFYMIVDQATGSAFGGLFYNSNAMTATVGPESLAFRSTGGIIDLWLFMGPRPSDVIFQYHQLIGTPSLVPYWSLGWHQSRYGYQNITVLNTVLTNYQKFNLPLDALWSDIDYMNLYENFQLNQTSYPTSNVTKFVTNLHALNKHYIPIVDAGIKQLWAYPSYQQGIQQNVFIQSPYNITTPPTPTVGVVWPGNATFVDWLSTNAQSYWNSQLSTFENLVFFSGIWTDMNENSNFINGEVNNPPSIITNETMPWYPGEDLNTRSLDMAAIHAGGVIEYNFHSLNGYYEAKATSNYFTQQLNIRPFVLSRSSFPGHGRYAFKWTGDNFSQWSFMEWSIVGVFNFNMFGIPMVGADICGFQGNTNEELCSRWMQLGTMYPFSRNHNAINTVSQEPYAFGPTLLTTSQMAIRNKYMLYLYFYTEMTLLSINGGMFFQPAFFEYPFDLNLLYNATASFMLGRALIVHPCLWQGITGTTSYFPNDIWYDFYTGDYMFLDYDNSVYLNMPLPGLINIHMIQGVIIPTVDIYPTAMDAGDTRNSNISLVITQGGGHGAFGTIIFDDGLSDQTVLNGNYTQMQYTFTSLNVSYDQFQMRRANTGYVRAPGEWPYISTLIFYGCTAIPETVWKSVRGVQTIISARFYWDLAGGVCKIWLKDNLTPDESSTLFIDYFI